MKKRNIFSRQAVNFLWVLLGLGAGLQFIEVIWAASKGYLGFFSMMVVIVTEMVITGSIYVIIYKFLIKPCNETRKLFKHFIQSGSFQELIDQDYQIFPEQNEVMQKLDSILDKKNIIELSTKHAELLALQNQINPHFLYNTLRSIRWMADVQGADNVTGAIDDLIQLFRLTTQIQGEYITIEEDLHIIRLYCEILMIRYMDCFTVEYEVDETLLSCKTIKFLLQPLLENAIYHGFQDWKKNALIRISVREEEGDVVFEVFDNGCGMDAETILRVLTLKKEDGKGLNKIGVNNVNMRIRRCFGEEYGLSFESEPGHYTIARAKIPKLVMEGAVTP